jgi:menaquinone-dependent protoporphyrinogen oxidase
MAQILFLYSTTDGQTLRICQHLQQVAEQHQHHAILVPIEQAATVELAKFDKIVIGASIRYGKHSPLVFEFVARHQGMLDSKPNAFFTVNVVARKPEKNTPETNPYMVKFLKRVNWKPQRLAVFAGKIDYPKLGFADRKVIQFIMWITKGPTDPTGTFEFTDWQKVAGFGDIVATM